MPGKTRLKPPMSFLSRTPSMRPQRNAGENGMPDGQHPPGSRASMRPQRNAGENRRHRLTGLCSVYMLQ